MTAAYIKRGARLPVLVIQLTEGGRPMDLAGFSAVLRGRDAAGVVVIDAPMSVVDAGAGKVAYAWAEADTAAVGGLDLEVRLVRAADGLVRVFPDEGYVSLVIAEALG